jgi:hypothetical protein
MIIKTQNHTSKLVLFGSFRHGKMGSPVGLKTQNHTSKLVLFGSLRHGKMGSPVGFVLDPRRNKTKKSSVSVLPHKRYLFSFTSLFAGTSPTPNRCTVANGSLPHLQYQWQWDHCILLVVINRLFHRITKRRRNYSMILLCIPTTKLNQPWQFQHLLHLTQQ